MISISRWALLSGVVLKIEEVNHCHQYHEVDQTKELYYLDIVPCPVPCGSHVES